MRGISSVALLRDAVQLAAGLGHLFARLSERAAERPVLGVVPLKALLELLERAIRPALPHAVGDQEAADREKAYDPADDGDDHSHAAEARNSISVRAEMPQARGRFPVQTDVGKGEIGRERAVDPERERPGVASRSEEHT